MWVSHSHSGLDKSAVQWCGTSILSFFQVCPIGKSPASDLPTNSGKSKLRLGQGKQKSRVGCLKGKLEFTFY